MALVCVSDYEREAKRKLPKAALGYYASGALTESTLKENKKSFQRWYICPRFMRDVSKRDMSTSILGMKVSVPFGVAPTAMQKMAHPDGEIANARAAASIGAPFTLSTISTSSVEEIGDSVPANSIKFFQLYIYKDRELTANLVRRVEKSGFQALVLTVDAPFFGIRYADLRNRFSMPPHLTMANFESREEPSDIIHLSKKGSSGISAYVASLFDPSLTWKDIAWLKSLTDLPIVVKGILSAEDAELSLQAGVSGIWVSNHGGRQIDGVYPTMVALEEVVEAVKGRCEVYVDGGFRTGPDIFKALALGAKMVFLGRPLIWGLTCNGQEGAVHILQILRSELDSTMALTGCPAIKDITKQMITPTNQRSKL